MNLLSEIGATVKRLVESAYNVGWRAGYRYAAEERATPGQGVAPPVAALKAGAAAAKEYAEEVTR